MFKTSMYTNKSQQCQFFLPQMQRYTYICILLAQRVIFVIELLHLLCIAPLIPDHNDDSETQINRPWLTYRLAWTECP